MKASDGGHLQCVKVLLDRGASVDKQNRVSAVGIRSITVERVQ